MVNGSVRVGTRGSPLALAQTREFMTCLSAHQPGLVPHEVVITTTGDTILTRRLADIGGKGLFSKEIHEALLDRTIDCAVHSLKDLETELPPGVVLACVLRREDPRDVLIIGPRCRARTQGGPLESIPRGSVIGSSSVRRQAQLLHARPDLHVESIRGNIQTRLAKLASGTCDASLLALAGLRRMGLAPANAIILDPAVMVPAASQGIVGITARADDDTLLAALAGIEHEGTRALANAERGLLAALDGSCRTPIGAFSRFLPDGQINLTGLVARPDGTFLARRDLSGAPTDADRLGRTLGATLRADSPADILR
jgi:hydroxymethylbilane synthase